MQRQQQRFKKNDKLNKDYLKYQNLKLQINNFKKEKKILQRVQKLKQQQKRQKSFLYFDTNTENMFTIAQNQLHLEINQFLNEFNQYQEKTQPKIQETVQHIKDTILQKFTFLQISEYGSYQTGLAMPWSDIDLVIDFPSQFTSSQLLDSLFEHLRKQDSFVKEIKLIDKTLVPIIKITLDDSHLGKKIDITLKQNDAVKHQGQECVKLINQYIQLFPPLKPLVLIFKQILFLARLHNPYQGGLSSYSIVLMLVAFLQFKQGHNYTNYRETQCPSLGTIFIEFLDFYNQWEFQTLMICPQQSIVNQTYVNQIFLIQQEQKFSTFSIQDPLNFKNNVAKVSFQYPQIQSLFQLLFHSSFIETDHILQNIFRTSSCFAFLNDSKQNNQQLN